MTQHIHGERRRATFRLPIKTIALLKKASVKWCVSQAEIIRVLVQENFGDGTE